MEDSHDRRRMCRKVALLEVIYREPAGASPDYATNLTDDGVYIATNQPFVIGQKVSLCLNVASPIEIDGVVRWRQVATATSEGGIGVEFQFDDSKTNQIRSRLRRLVKRLRPM